MVDEALLRDRVTAAVGDLYLIGREVGRGGMAVVYAAEDVRLRRPVALKVLPPDLAFRPDVRERFVREAQTAARLNHPHIVPIYAVHEVQGLVCFAMSLVHGETLATRLLREPRPPFAFVASMLEQMADALAYAHACGVVHRDIKPDNVLLDRDSGRALVTDFGIARAAESGSRLTQTGIAVGTPAFMSPEQAVGDREVDGRSDLYSVGVIGYLMVAGQLPFDALSTPAMLMKQVSDAPPPLRTLRPDAPRALIEILDRCLAKAPQDRWDSALQLRDTLRRVQRDGSLERAAVRGPGEQLAVSAAAGRTEGKFGNRAEDWTPRPVALPAPAAHELPVAAVSAAELVNRFRTHTRWLAGSILCGAVSFLVGGVTSADPLIFPFVGGIIGTMVSAQLAMMDIVRLRRIGISPRAVWKGEWRKAQAARDTRPHDRKLAELVEKVGGPLVTGSRYADVVRNAADDRLVIEEITSKLTTADRTLVPDTEPTADALLERIGALASGLERLDRDLPVEGVRDMAQRIAAVEREPATSPDRERRLSLLTRQQASLDDLQLRRDEMQRQIERASLALRSLRLDVVKLRMLGIQAAGDITSATQEARVVSRELGYALEAAEESRRL